MKFYLSNSSVELAKKNKRKHIWYKVVSVLAAMVVFCTAYVLILPAITITEDYYCGFEEHQHDKKCYNSDISKINACIETTHQHDTTCYDERGNLICGLVDYFIHTHSEICYDENGILVCVLPEKKEHQHTEACYIGELLYSCGMKEKETHQHVEECYYQTDTLICEQEEREAHQHTDICYTQTNTLTCALEEREAHQHTDVCYQQTNTLACGQEECVGHQHIEICYDQAGMLICGLAEQPPHQHTNLCYTQASTLICGQEEHEGHQHADVCYEQSKALTCELEECEAHQHTDTCYVKEKKVQCALNEGEPHKHGENCTILSKPTLACGLQEVICEAHTEVCRNEEGKLVCGKWMAVEHNHTDACFEIQEIAEPMLICELQEHVHTVMCTSDKNADVESAEIWRKTVPDNTELTGILSEDLLAVAKSQIDYQESVRNFEVNEAEERKGYTRYGKWYGDPYGDWDAMFVSFCLYYAGIPEEVFPYESDAELWIENLKSMELYCVAEEYQPTVGDVIFYEAEDKICAGIISKMTEEEPIELTVIEGNFENFVKSNTYSLAEISDSILGYGSLEAAYQRGVELGLLKEVEENLDENLSEENAEGSAVENETDEKHSSEENTENPADETELEESIDEEEKPSGENPENSDGENLTEESDTIELQADYGEMHIILTAPKDAFLVSADSLELVVSEPDASMKESIVQSLGEEQTYVAVDIKILCDGEETQPLENVEVKFAMKNDPFAEEETVEVYHAEMEAESQNVNFQPVVSERDAEGNIIMEAEHFSTYVITTADATDESAETSNEIQLEADYGEIHIILNAPKDAFPVSASSLDLVVSEPAESIKESIRQNMGEEYPYFAVDIKILCDGEEIQPSAKVKVKFEMQNNPFAMAEAVEVYHVVEETPNGELNVQQVVSEYDVEGNVVMETSHFSTYVVTAAEEETSELIIPYALMPNTYQEALTDRSSYIGVASEGYADSPYTKTREFAGSNITSLESSGGTVYVGGKFWGVYYDYANYAETFWDGTKPVRITSQDPNNQNELRKTIYSDWILDDHEGNTQIAPYAPIKIDNVAIDLWGLGNQKFEMYGRSNKIVIGENVNTDDLMGHSAPYIYGGSRSNDSTTMGYPTNVVVTSGRWGLVMGGGGADANDGTQVTIRDTAQVGIIYGGGIDKGDVRAHNDDEKPSYNTTGNATNVFIEGGSVGEVYGGNQTTDTGIKVTGNINIDVSGGRVTTIHAGNDHRGVEGGDELAGSTVRGGAVVNIYNTGSVTNLIGDYMHYDLVHGDTIITYKNGPSSKGRHIMKLAELNVHSNNEFGIMDYWDVIRINNLNTNAAPNSVNVSSRMEILTFGSLTNDIGSEYIGRMEVTNGGRFYLKGNSIINYMNEVSTTTDKGAKLFDLKHGWKGESTEERRAWSTLAIEGNIIKPSTAATNLFTLSNPCDNGQAGLRIKGNVEGFSTLEACGTPMYSTGDTYYYYVVADSSDNGGKAFKEPEGAPYVVCYRYLDDGRIGWYLRERPVMTMENKFVRVGTEEVLTLTENGVYTSYPATYMVLHVDMKGFAYEWSKIENKNRVDFAWTVMQGSESASKVDVDGISGISIKTMADIANNIRTTDNPKGIFANVRYDATGTDEGSTEVVPKVSSFDIIIDKEQAVEARYYDISANFHYTRGTDYDDLRVGKTVDAARCTYDFAKNDELLGNENGKKYTDSVMTTYEYLVAPRGKDDALLRVYLPEGVTANSLTVKELDNQFTFTNSEKSASLVSNSQVQANYSTEDESKYNHQFAVTLQDVSGTEKDLASGAVLNKPSGKTTYPCWVYSHAKIDYTDITPENASGLQLELQLNTLTKSGATVGSGNPSTQNDGELRIQVLPVGTVIETTTITVEKIVVDANKYGENVKKSEFEFLLAYSMKDEEEYQVMHEERFTLSHGEKQVIMVPLGTEITVQEVKHDGYYVQTKNNNGDFEYNDTLTVTTPSTSTGNEELLVTFYNRVGTEMPSTGGSGTQTYTLLGLILITGAFVLFWGCKRGRRVVN